MVPVFDLVLMGWPWSVQVKEDSRIQADEKVLVQQS